MGGEYVVALSFLPQVIKLHNFLNASSGDLKTIVATKIIIIIIVCFVLTCFCNWKKSLPIVRKALERKRGEKERQRKRDRERDRDRETERDRQRDRERERQTERQRDRERQRERQRETESD